MVFGAAFFDIHGEAQRKVLRITSVEVVRA